MKTATKFILIVLTVILTIAFLRMVAVCISMKVDYWDAKMGNEAYGFFTLALMVTFLISIPTIILWIILLKQKRIKAS
jgi:hypothetical protein